MDISQAPPHERFEFIWRWPEDASRVAPVPGGTTLTVLAEPGARVRCGDGDWLAVKFSEHHGTGAAYVNVPAVGAMTELPLMMRADGKECAAVILALPAQASLPAARSSHGVCANRVGTCVQARAAWGGIESKYDALLAANLNAAGPDDRRVVFTRARQWLRRGAEFREVTGDAVTEFTAVSHRELEWSFAMMGAQWAVRLTLGDANAVRLRWHSWQAADDEWEFVVRPDLENRSFHGVTQAFRGPEMAFRDAVQSRTTGLSFDLGKGWRLELESGAHFEREAQWTYMVPLPFEEARGLEPATDLFSPGAFRWKAGEMELRAEVSNVARDSSQESADCGPEGQAALELFLAERDGGLTVIAGFPWFLDWGRDSLIFARGLAAAGQVNEALSIVRRFAEFVSGGSIPNLIRGTDASNRETSDAPLWLVIALRDIAAVRPSALAENAGSQTLAQVACDIVRAHLEGTRHGVRFDAASGLLWSPAHYTWMDTDRPAGTPREGYPVEIQALWAAALEFGHSLNAAAGWAELAERVRQSVARLFWREADGFLADCLHAPAGVPAAEATADDHLRPNQLLAITLGLLRDAGQCRRILSACQCLLIPGALRSLAPRRVNYPLPVEWNGGALHDPHAPYHGSYTGPEETSRKPAYHNGTAWTWLYPTFCEALALVFPGQRDEARAMMSASAWLMRDGCAGQLAEIADGDAPHALRGCGAQAWSVSEWLRVQAG